MLYNDSVYDPVESVLEEWATAAGTSRLEILRRLCCFGDHGLIFDRWAFRLRYTRTYLDTRRVQQIVEASASATRELQSDSAAALKELMVSREAIRDFCRVTGTRLPDAALGSKHRTLWLDVTHVAPPGRPPTARELEALKLLYTRRAEVRAQRQSEAHQGFKVLKARGARPRQAVKQFYEAPRYQRPDVSRSGGIVDAEAPQSIACALASTSLHNCPQDERDAPRPVSKAEITGWYRGHVASVSPGEKPPTRDESWAAAQAAFPDKLVTKARVRALRRKLSPDWCKPGRPKSGGMKSDAKESDA
jgi:hypothetical protein